MRSEELGDAGALLNITCWKIDQIDHGKSIIYNVRLLGALSWVRVHKGRSGHIFVKIPI